jgi:hypothetical protein
MSDDTISEQRLGTAGDRQNEQDGPPGDDSEHGTDAGDVEKGYIYLVERIRNEDLRGVVKWITKTAVEHR